AINIVLATLTISNESEVRKDARRLKEIQLTNNNCSEYVTFSYIIPFILGLINKLDCSTDYFDESNDINFETSDLAFDNNVGFVDAQEEEKGSPKERKIKINTPIDITNIQCKIKNALYNALLHYWNFSKEELFLAYLLNLRFKKLRFATSTQQLKAKAVL
ncbi:5615_t:CDS:2, partial [Cetraspora pellucida]